MFDNYYDDVTYRKAGQKDKFGNEGLGVRKDIQVRKVRSQSNLVIGDIGSSVKQVKKYHVPTDINIAVGDELDGSVVSDVRPSRGIGGRVFFWIVEVVQ